MARGYEAATIRDIVTGLPLPKDIDRELLRLALDNTVAYAVVTFQTAYLKCRWPKEFR